MCSKTDSNKLITTLVSLQLWLILSAIIIIFVIIMFSIILIFTLLCGLRQTNSYSMYTEIILSFISFFFIHSVFSTVVDSSNLV